MRHPKVKALVNRTGFVGDFITFYKILIFCQDT